MKMHGSRWVVLSILFLPRLVLGYEISSGPCEFTAEELADPDKVVQLTLSGKKFCPGFHSKEAPFDGEVHPKHALAKLPPDPDSETGETGSGIYREFKIVERKDIQIEGREAKVYTVKLLYTILPGNQHVKGAIGSRGLVPACESNIAKVYAINTPKGWYATDSTNIGFSELSVFMSIRKNPRVPYAERLIAEYKSVSAKCKAHLN